MSVRVGDLCRSIKDEHDPKRFTALIGELIRVLDEERSIKARFAGSLLDQSLSQPGSDSNDKGEITDASSGF